MNDRAGIFEVLKPIDRSAVTDMVLEQIKNLIRSQNLKTGDRLPTERKLVEILGVSRPPIREALKTLEVMGLIETVQGSGTYIKEPNFDFTDFPMEVLLNKEKEIINELIEAREIIETQIVTLAMKRMKDTDMARLEKFTQDRMSFEEMKRLEDSYNYDFEELLGEIAGNRVLLTLQKAVHALWESSLKKIGFQPIPVGMINQEHMRILEAIRNRDGKSAKKAMVYHLRAPLRIISEK